MREEAAIQVPTVVEQVLAGKGVVDEHGRHS